MKKVHRFGNISIPEKFHRNLPGILKDSNGRDLELHEHLALPQLSLLTGGQLLPRRHRGIHAPQLVAEAGLRVHRLTTRHLPRHLNLVIPAKVMRPLFCCFMCPYLHPRLGSGVGHLGGGKLGNFFITQIGFILHILYEDQQ